MSRESILLVRRQDDQAVAAVLLGGLKPEDLRLVERTWTIKRQEMMRGLLAENVPRTDWPESLHWDWSTKAGDLRLLSHLGWAIECDNQFQGVMLLDVVRHAAQIEGDRGKHLVYIEYLEVAPWNWDCEPLGQRKVYRGVGQALFQRAVEQSRDEGFRGRIGLHALPRAEGFYEQAFGMTRLEPDPNKEGLVYFELSEAAAQRCLKTEEEQ